MYIFEINLIIMVNMYEIFHEKIPSGFEILFGIEHIMTAILRSIFGHR